MEASLHEDDPLDAAVLHKQSHHVRAWQRAYIVSRRPWAESLSVQEILF